MNRKKTNLRRLAALASRVTTGSREIVSHSTTLLRCAALCSAVALAASANAELIPASRMTDWTPSVTVGVPGGIPNRTRLIDVTQSPYNADKTGGTNATPAIQAAVNAAVSGDVVYLPAGTYRLDSTLYIDQSRDGITLRGAGIGATVLDTRMPATAIYVGSGSDYLWNNPSSGNTVTAGQTKGSSTITLANTSAFAVGGLINLGIQNQANDDAIRNGAVPAVSIAGYPNLRRQMARVVSKTATTLTFSPALYDSYAGLAITVTTAGFSTEFTGIEDLTISCGTGGTQVGIQFEQTYACWAKNVKVSKAGNYAFSIFSSLRAEVRGSFADQRSSNGSNGGGVVLGMSSGCLIEDNILYKFFPLIEVNGGASGNVFAYNFCYDSSVFGVSGMAIDSNHAPHNAFNLYEGNIGSTIQADGYFGGCSEDTIFRNWWHGTNPPDLQGWHSIVLNRFTRNYNIVGNLLGFTGKSDGLISFGNPNMGNGGYSGTAQPSAGKFWNDWKMSATLSARVSDEAGTLTLNSGALTTTQYITITWGTGSRRQFYPGTVNGNTITFSGGAGNLLPAVGTTVEVFTGSGGYQELDLDVGATSVVKGNWHAKDGGIPAAEALGSDILPASLYRSSKPSWFGDLAWPAFDPSSPNQSFEAIPAGYRYFHGSAPSGTEPVPQKPTNVRVQIQTQ
jgi:hypothetical protein